MKIMYLMVCIIFLVFGPLSAENAAAIEEAGFTVFYQSDPFEIRRYQPRIVAETYVAGDFDEVGNVGFRRLFDYISGNNRSQAKIEMTSPVTQEPQSEKIEMTAAAPRTTLDRKAWSPPEPPAAAEWLGLHTGCQENQEPDQ